MELTPGLKKAAAMLKSMGIIRGINMTHFELRCLSKLSELGLATKEPDHKRAIEDDFPHMFKYTASKALKELDLENN